MALVAILPVVLMIAPRQWRSWGCYLTINFLLAIPHRAATECALQSIYAIALLVLRNEGGFKGLFWSALRMQEYVVGRPLEALHGVCALASVNPCAGEKGT